ncbi:hypothetical protein PCASD_26888 [Puccinia coronata f. sp. avenae]|uniref:Uncharacterized protein n=1 Tax=Puccinia coronata f. sp. avenae TaxID=200324 RepID=A0A2N5RUC5_9BASI|nr:hypothetical protein PCASD_26888 [Puccinia coronata f. sp. avenae]
MFLGDFDNGLAPMVELMGAPKVKLMAESTAFWFSPRHFAANCNFFQAKTENSSIPNGNKNRKFIPFGMEECLELDELTETQLSQLQLQNQLTQIQNQLIQLTQLTQLQSQLTQLQTQLTQLQTQLTLLI